MARDKNNIPRSPGPFVIAGPLVPFVTITVAGPSGPLVPFVIPWSPSSRKQLT